MQALVPTQVSKVHTNGTSQHTLDQIVATQPQAPTPRPRARQKALPAVAKPKRIRQKAHTHHDLPGLDRLIDNFVVDLSGVIREIAIEAVKEVLGELPAGTVRRLKK